MYFLYFIDSSQCLRILNATTVFDVSPSTRKRAKILRPMDLNNSSLGRGIRLPMNHMLGRGRGFGRGIPPNALLDKLSHNSQSESGQESHRNTLPVQPNTATNSCSYNSNFPQLNSDIQSSVKPKHFKKDRHTNISHKYPGAMAGVNQSESDHGNDVSGTGKQSRRWMSTASSSMGGSNYSILQGQLDKLEYMYDDDTKKDKIEVKQLLKDFLFSSDNFFKAALFFIENSKDYYVSKTTTVSYFVVSELASMVKSNRNLPMGWEALLNQDIKIHAFCVSTRYADHNALLEKAIVAFRLRVGDKEYLVPAIKDLCTAQKYKTVSNYGNTIFI